MAQGQEDLHVHFAAETEKKVDPDPHVKYERIDDVLHVNLHLLQQSYKYAFDMQLPGALLAEFGTSVNDFQPDVRCAQPLLECSASGTANPAANVFELKVELYVYKELPMLEKVSIIDKGTSLDVFQLEITARVLGRHMGKPMLVNGVHCLEPAYVKCDFDEDGQTTSGVLPKVTKST